MVRQQQQKPHSLRNKAAHFVSDLTAVLLNPISDKPSKPVPPHPPPPPDSEDGTEAKGNQLESITKEDSGDLDTSSFSAFLYSLLSSSESGTSSNFEEPNDCKTDNEPESDVKMKESSAKKSIFSRGKQSVGRAIYQAAKFGGYRNRASANGSSDMMIDDGSDSEVARDEGISMQTFNKPVPLDNVPLDNLPGTSEPSLLLSEKTRSALYVALPALVQGRKWVLLYSTWRHGISLSTLYRRSMLCPGLSLLVVGDRKGAVFGGLVEAPLRPTNKRRYQGTNNSFVFTNAPGYPVIFRPTGVNRYFTLCSTDYLALGGGSHFALYLDGDLLNGSSSASETYGNSCLAITEDFEVKEIELWSFVYASKYEEMVSFLRMEASGICRW